MSFMHKTPFIRFITNDLMTEHEYMFVDRHYAVGMTSKEIADLEQEGWEGCAAPEGPIGENIPAYEVLTSRFFFRREKKS